MPVPPRRCGRLVSEIKFLKKAPRRKKKATLVNINKKRWRWPKTTLQVSSDSCEERLHFIIFNWETRGSPSLTSSPKQRQWSCFIWCWWTLLCRSLLKFTPWSLPPSLLTKSRKLESCQLFCVLYIMFHTSGLRNCCDVSPSGFRPHQICASAAFDTVNHNKDQKTVLGFSGTVRNWFNSCGHFLIGDYTSEHPKNVVEFPKARYSDLFCSTSTCCHPLLQCNRHFFFFFFYIFLAKRNMTVMLQKLSTYNRCMFWTNMKAFHLI